MSRKYHLEERGISHMSGMLSQNIKAGGRETTRDVNRSIVNQLFRTNQKLFYETLDGKKPGETVLPDRQKQTPGGRSDLEVGHTERVSWLENVEAEFRCKRRTLSVWRILELECMSKEANWKAGDPDLVQEFWLKETVSVAIQMARMLARLYMLRGCTRVDNQG